MKISKEAIEAGARAAKATFLLTSWHVNELAGEVIRAALPHLQPQPAPPATATQVAIDDAEMERVARAMCFAWHEAHEVTLGNHDWTSMHPEGQAKWKKTARAAIRAIREGGQRWGVWNVTSKSWVVNTQIDAPRHWSGSEDDAQFVCVLMSKSHPRLAFQVLPYPGEREKTPEEQVAEKYANLIMQDTKSKSASVPTQYARVLAAIQEAAEAAKGGREG